MATVAHSRFAYELWRAMVVRLAETLELSLRERNQLLLAAGYAPLFPESGLDDESLRPVREALVTVLEGASCG
jgi:hypothetical protein